MVSDEWLVTRTTDDPQWIGRIKSGDDAKQSGAAGGVPLRLEIRTGPRLFLALLAEHKINSEKQQFQFRAWQPADPFRQ
jgi:hypothetical protein